MQATGSVVWNGNIKELYASLEKRNQWFLRKENPMIHMFYKCFFSFLFLFLHRFKIFSWVLFSFCKNNLPLGLFFFKFEIWIVSVHHGWNFYFYFLIKEKPQMENELVCESKGWLCWFKRTVLDFNLLFEEYNPTTNKNRAPINTNNKNRANIKLLHTWWSDLRSLRDSLSKILFNLRRQHAIFMSDCEYIKRGSTNVNRVLKRTREKSISPIQR